MYIYDNTNLLTKRRRKTRAKILDQIKILSLIHNDEKIEEIQNEGIKPPQSASRPQQKPKNTAKHWEINQRIHLPIKLIEVNFTVL